MNYYLGILLLSFCVNNLFSADDKKFTQKQYKLIEKVKTLFLKVESFQLTNINEPKFNDIGWKSKLSSSCSISRYINSESPGIKEEKAFCRALNLLLVPLKEIIIDEATYYISMNFSNQNYYNPKGNCDFDCMLNNQANQFFRCFLKLSVEEQNSYLSKLCKSHLLSVNNYRYCSENYLVYILDELEKLITNLEKDIPKKVQDKSQLRLCKIM